MSRVLILYIVRNSGHHAAARHIEEALQRQAPACTTLCLDLLEHTHPKWERLIERMYMGTIRRTPELWEALYDNFWVDHLTVRLRRLIEQGKSSSLLRLMDDFAPDAVICTQAHALAVISSFSLRHGNHLPLFGVTTDFVPHRFWVMPDPHVRYVVATASGAARLMWLGVERARIEILGIPVSAALEKHRDTPRSPGRRRILVMGGSRGLGIRYETVRALDASPIDFTIDVISGTNRALQRRLVRNRHRFRHPIRVRGYVQNAALLMSRADLLITKAGGVTLAEAMALGVPLILVRPLPGQESGNTQALVHHGAALHIRNEGDFTRSITSLLGNPDLLDMMRRSARALGRPRAAADIAQCVLEQASKHGLA